MARGTRPRKNRIEVWCNEEEFSQISEHARGTRLSRSEFLRNLGRGYEPKSTFDREAIRQLAKLHADQGRLGGLLKLSLSEKSGDFASRESMRSLLQQIERLQLFIARLVMEEARRL